MERVPAGRAKGQVAAIPTEAMSPVQSSLDGTAEAVDADPEVEAPIKADDENWDQRLGFLIHDVARLRRCVFDQRLARFGMTRSQWWILVYVARNPGATQTELAKTMDIGKAALGALALRIEAAGLATRRSDPADGRVCRAYISAKGKRMIKKMQVGSSALSEEMLQGLSSDQRHKLADLLQVVKQSLIKIKD